MPVDKAVRRARWHRLRSERAARSQRVQQIGLAGAILVLFLGITATIGPAWNPLAQAQETQQAIVLAQEAARAEAVQARLDES